MPRCSAVFTKPAMSARRSASGVPSAKAKSNTVPNSFGPPSVAINNRALSVRSAGSFPARNSARQRRNDVFRPRRLQGKRQMLGTAVEAHSARLQRREPNVAQIAGRQPNGIIEKPIDRLIERPHRHFGRRGGMDLRQRPHRLQPDARIFVGDPPGQQVERVGHLARPVTEHSHSGSPRVRLVRFEQRAEQIRRDVPERLIGPEGFEPIMRALRIGRVEPLDPGRERGDHFRAALLQQLLRLAPRVSLGRFEIVEQRRVGRVDEFGPLDERPPLGRHAPNPSVRVIAARIAEIDFAMLNDRIVPIGDIEGAVGAHLHVDRAKRRMIRLDEFGHFLGGKARAVFREHIAADPMGAKIVGDQIALPIGRKLPPADDFERAILGAARIEAGQNAPGVGRGRVTCPRHDVVDSLAAGPIGDERLAPIIPLMPPGIDPAAGENAQFHCLGAETPNPPGIQRSHAVGRLDVAMNVDRLIEIHPAVGPPIEGMDDVMRVFGAEAAEHDPPRVGMPRVLRVGKEQQLGAVGHVAPPSPGSTPVGINKPSANTVVLFAWPAPVVSSRIRILSLAFCPGRICG